MTRKLIALIVTTLLLFGLFPAAAAFASATGTAQLTTALTTFPRDNTTATVRVNNNEAPIVGARINYVDIILPAGTAGVVLDSAPISVPTGWTVKTDVVGTFQAVTFKTTGAGLAPGQNMAFTVPVDVTRPLNSDKSGAFNVAISSNGGTNTRAASAATPGALTMNVKILELIGGSLGATSPAGVTDNGATGGQSISYGYSLRNYAQQAVSVTTTLASSDNTDIINPPARLTSIPGDPAASTTLSHSILLGPAKTANRTSQMSVTATSTGASANPLSRNLSVEMEPDATFNALSPTRVRSGLGANYTFQVNAAKSGTPALSEVTGSLSFAQTTTRLPAATTFGANANSKMLQFEQVEVAGASGSYPPTVALTGVDANGKAFSVSKLVDTSIIIDNLAPVIKTVDVTIPANQTAAKDGDTIRVDGCITNAVEDIRLNSLRVVLDPNVGNDTVITATTAAGAAGSGCDYTFTGSASPQWEVGATSFKAVAEVADTAGNIGGGVSPDKIIDQILPILQNFGRTESSREIRVQFTDELTSAIAGGCDERAWLIDDTPGLVERVSFSGETGSCKGQGSDGSGTRILLLREVAAMDQDDTPKVTYQANSLVNSDPAQDGAKNSAITTAIQTVSGIRPAAPTIVTIERNAGAELAHQEADGNDSVTNYYTRFPGTGDPATEDLLVTFGGARTNYLIQVVDGQGRVLTSKTLTNPNTLAPQSDEFNADVRVPIGTTDGGYRRGIRLVGNNNEGDISWFDVVLDTVVPTIANQSLQSDGQTVVVNFREPLVGGTDFANDWLAKENVTDGEQWYRAMDVISTDADTRTITFPLQAPSGFAGAHYRLTSEGGVRYEDRGGNLMANTLN